MNTTKNGYILPFWIDFFENIKDKIPDFILPSMNIALSYYQFHLKNIPITIHFECIRSVNGLTICFHCEDANLIKTYNLEQFVQEIITRLSPNTFFRQSSGKTIGLYAKANHPMEAIPLLLHCMSIIGPAVYQTLNQSVPSSKQGNLVSPLIYDDSLIEEEEMLRQELGLACTQEKLSRMTNEEKSIWRKKHNRWWNLRAFQNLALQGHKVDFSLIFAQGGWQSPQNESVSGSGSTMAQTGVTREVITRCLNIYPIQSILDIPCGDYNWMKHIHRERISYLGGDIEPQLIAQNKNLYSDENTHFKVMDVKTDSLEGYDLIIVRDLFIHLTFEEIFAALSNIALSSCRYVLINNYMNIENIELSGGYRLVNLLDTPFSLPKPIYSFHEKINAQPHRNLCLWPRDEISCYYNKI